MSATFTYDTWVARFPMFTDVPEALAQEYFNEAAIYFDNVGWPGSLPQAQTLMNLLTAHIAQLNKMTANGQLVSNLVGRISNASQGSVSVTADMGTPNASSPSQAWYEQTPFGAAYFAGIKQFISARYRPNPTRVVNSIFPSNPYRRW